MTGNNSTPPPKFYTETVTLAEHQLLKRIRQLCRKDGTVILVVEIETREKLRSYKGYQGTITMQKLE